MFKLEEAIQEWRQSLGRNGFGADATSDELEAHLRDAIDQLRQSGLDEVAAFQTAVERLGSPEQLRPEFAKALTPSARFRRLLTRRVDLFPRDMRVCAWGAIPASVFLFWETVLTLRLTENQIAFGAAVSNGSPAFLATTAALFGFPVLFGIFGILTALRYLRSGNPAVGRPLVTFWSVLFWLVTVFTLAEIHTFSQEYSYTLVGNQLKVLRSIPPLWTFPLTIGLALIGYQYWKRSLLAPEPTAAD